jgi:hypothetical protein
MVVKMVESCRVEAEQEVQLFLMILEMQVGACRYLDILEIELYGNVCTGQD